MSDVIQLAVGGSAAEDGEAFIDAWERSARGEHVPAARLVSFESWAGLAAVLTGERFRLLRHLNAHPEPSVSALARSLGRQFRRVHADVAALEGVGLVDRSSGTVRATADRINTIIRLDEPVPST